MLIPIHHRKLLKSIGYTRWFWTRTFDWAFGERYRFRDGSIAYINHDEIISIVRADRVLWRKEME